MILKIFRRKGVFGKHIANSFFLNFLIFKIFVGKLTKNGKKLRSLNFVYSIFLKLREQYLIKNSLEYGEINKSIKSIDGAFLFFYAIKQVLPIFKIITIKVSGATYHLPYPLINPKISISVALKEIIKNSYKRKEQNLVLKLYNEIIDSIKKKSTTYFNKKSQYKIGFNGIPFLRFVVKKKKRSKYSYFTSKRWKINRTRKSKNLIQSDSYFSKALTNYKNKKIKKKKLVKFLTKKLNKFKNYYLPIVLKRKYKNDFYFSENSKKKLILKKKLLIIFIN